MRLYRVEYRGPTDRLGARWIVSPLWENGQLRGGKKRAVYARHYDRDFNEDVVAAVGFYGYVFHDDVVKVVRDGDTFYVAVLRVQTTVT